MIPKKLAPAKAGVADFSDKIMRKIKENREDFRFNLIEERSLALIPAVAASAIAGGTIAPISPTEIRIRHQSFPALSGAQAYG
jgi:hypothetical protein